MKKLYFIMPLLLLLACTVQAQFKTYFISPTGNDGNNGLSIKQAWKTLDKVNTVVFQPGDQLLFETGSTWRGQLKPQGQGEKGSPIILSSYGYNAKPVINIGSAEGAGIRLTNQSWWEINNMEITSGAPPQLGIGRQGIVAIAKGDNQHVEHIVVKNCYVHDVWGQLGGNTEYTGYYSCGILVNIQRDRNRDRSKPVTTTINDVLVEGNRIERMDKCGIIVWGGKNNVIVRNNSMDNLGGDGIFVNGTYKGMIEHNVVKRSCMRSGNLDLSGGEKWWPHTAAIWIQDASETIMQYNEVYDTGREPGNGDGEAYDFDFNCRRCVCQYNYSKNNNGFLLIMNETFNNITRYNISENDKTHLIQLQCDTTERNIIHNNIFYVDYGTADLDFFCGNDGKKDKTKLGARFNNNIFYATGQGRFRTAYSYGEVLTRQFNDSVHFTKAAGTLFEGNCYFGPWKKGLPDDAAKLVADPRFIAPGTGGEGLATLVGYKLNDASPCINKGILIPWNANHDFWGNPVIDGSTDIGAYEQAGSGVFADTAKQGALNRIEEVKYQLGWARKTFPKAYKVQPDGNIVITLRDPLLSSIKGTITWQGQPAGVKPASVVVGNTANTAAFTFSAKTGEAIPADAKLHVVLQYQGLQEEWDIPAAAK